MKTLTDEEVVDRAEKWVRFHKKPETRARMDECLTGIDKEDQRRVYLCGQRINSGLKAKVLPRTRKESENDNGTTKTARTTHRSGQGDEADKGAPSVGSGVGSSRKSDQRRDPKRKKQ